MELKLISPGGSANRNDSNTIFDVSTYLNVFIYTPDISHNPEIGIDITINKYQRKGVDEELKLSENDITKLEAVLSFEDAAILGKFLIEASNQYKALRDEL